VKGGETITVLDRDTPVARIVPIGATGNGLVVRPPLGKRKLSEIPLPPPSGMKRDIVELLLADRNSGR
jgi:antitoxin (DNA-binding transcriptional repressor) of toxin-antitoxin stability system